jgi:cytochrome oxidase assembly protein ShyY1
MKLKSDTLSLAAFAVLLLATITMAVVTTAWQVRDNRLDAKVARIAQVRR